MYNVNHVLYKSFLPQNSIPAVLPNDFVNVNVKFIPLCSCVYVARSLSRSLCVSILKAPVIFIVNTALTPNVCNLVSSINPTYCICESPEYTHCAIVNNPIKIPYLRHNVSQDVSLCNSLYLSDSLTVYVDHHEFFLMSFFEPFVTRNVLKIAWHVANVNNLSANVNILI